MNKQLMVAREQLDLSQKAEETKVLTEARARATALATEQRMEELASALQVRIGRLLDSDTGISLRSCGGGKGAICFIYSFFTHL